MITIVPLYAGILALVYVVLTLRTIRGRRKNNISVGTGDNMAFMRLVRAHGNFSEYVPFIVFLLALIELQTEWPIFIHIAGTILVLSRIIHAVGVSNVEENFILRKSAMVLTILLLVVTGGINIYIATSRFLLPS